MFKLIQSACTCIHSGMLKKYKSIYHQRSKNCKSGFYIIYNYKLDRVKENESKKECNFLIWEYFKWIENTIFLLTLFIYCHFHKIKIKLFVSWHIYHKIHYMRVSIIKRGRMNDNYKMINNDENTIFL